ncbi:MAG: restriction endonuclease subunit S [Ewingella americana]|jgi:type I restriction enzyme S subunit|uniref:restriction endonuclease subunit S n=1 Tax=Ewingella americana TaxID=41202 RepID=UPI0024316F06|nr:restriction endonuclease subunit S [Ewingella americana]MCI1678085.1 restriction endonuclease subunit S [Ewingella americana]MCI1855973.1 restriction endonuclease subunit S [Ewingella americana]MCI1863459.1 restriction endonuclease subunit S [Ewingella americana]MCI2144119.1 restriction endonuclease subunit S [Ewingella americana]MCI2163971.1 restriction endonuclease subunit S [Ewingella americana]
MDAKQFLAEFGHIANAPGGIGKLRELILQLAVQGKLIVYTASDVSSRVLLDEVRALKAELVSCKKLPRQKPYPEVLRREIAVDVPSHWEWARFGELWQLLSGRDLVPSKYNDSKNGIPYITGASNIVNGIIVVNRWTPDPVVISSTGDLLITCKGTIGKTVFNTLGEVHIARQIMAIRNFSKKLNTGFLKIWLDGFVSQLVEKSKSMIPGFSRDDLELAAYPVLPIEEQSRIVAKVEELMALCDKLEAQQQARRILQNALRQSTLQAVAKTNSPHELQSTWTCLAENFRRLFHAPEDVGQLRDLILDLAVHGLLVEQSEADEPINNWLADVTATKSALAKQKLIAKQTAMTALSEDELPFSLPKGWAFVRLGQITNKIGSGSTPRGGRDVYVKKGIPFLRSQNVWNDGLHLDDIACITTEEHERMSGTAVLGNDVLLNITGASLGRCTLVPSEFGEANVSQHVTIIRLTDPQVREYLHICIMSPYTQSMIWERQVGMAREGLSKKVLEQFEIPLPPIAEQHRIVALVKELMRFCDVMERQLKRSLQVAEKLAVASVASITGIAIEQEEEPMKAPQTELIAPLRLGTVPDIKAQAPLATILARHHGEMSAKDLWQRFGGEIDAFYAQLKIEVLHGWILEPAPAEVREKPSDAVSA